jgi:hypothetical protein
MHHVATRQAYLEADWREELYDWDKLGEWGDFQND